VITQDISLQDYKYYKSQTKQPEIMTQKPRTPEKSIFREKNIKASGLSIRKKQSGHLQSCAAGKPVKSIQEMGAPFHIMDKEDIEKELSRIKEMFNMNPDEFYKAWKEDKVHGFHALKFGCLYEYYRNEYA